MGNRRSLTCAIAALGIVVLTLTGCSAFTETDGPSGQTNAPTTSLPTAAESPAPVTAASIVLSVTSIQIVDSSGATLSEHDYFEPAADVVAVLSDAFGSEPIVSQYDSHADSPSGTSYDWDGFDLRDNDWPAETPYYSEFSVLLTAPKVGGLPISTSDGVSVGDSFSGVTEANPAHAEFSADGMVSLEWTELPAFPEGYGVDTVPAISVLVIDSGLSGVVSRILAPAANWGG